MITKRFNGERLLEIGNSHVADCGSPPSLDATDKYVGYFENPFGEQWVFIGDRKTGKAVVRGGDVGWERETEISFDRPCPDMVLDEAEKLWVITCFMAMSSASFDYVAGNYNKAAVEMAAATESLMVDCGDKPVN